MKRRCCLFLAVIAALCCLSACGGRAADVASAPSWESGEDTEPVQREPMRIVATIFPEYDWVRAILGGHISHAEITLLLDDGTDLHSYQPTDEDISRIAACDLFLYVGGTSDEPLRQALEKMDGENRRVISLVETLGDRVNEAAPPVSPEYGENGEEGTQPQEGPIRDEHVWLSLKNAALLCGKIAEALAEIDPENGADYLANAAAYSEELAALDADYRNTVENAAQTVLLFGDRCPFCCLAGDYGLTCYAPFAGCAEEAEVEAETVSFLARKADELDLPCILTLEGSDQKLAQAVVQNSKTKDMKILTLNAMQSVTFREVSNGASYLSIMEQNFAVLREALQSDDTGSREDSL